MTEIERIREALAALEGQRGVLGDQVVDAAVGPIREKLATLTAIATPEQRKLVTVLFSDLAGFTAMTESHDSEDIRDIVNAYFTRWTAAIEDHGGMVEKFIGDAVMAVFGLTMAHEDDAERAIRAALAMRQSLHELNVELVARQMPDLVMRVGIVTGQVVVSFFGERRGSDVVVVGDAVNMASRLQAQAPDDGVLISHHTYGHVRGVFDVEPVAPLVLKGLAEPVPAYLVLRAKPRSFRLEPHRVEDVETRLIGREAELDRAQDAVEGALDDGTRAMVTIIGEAGIGKSRLLYEVDNWLELRPERVARFVGRAVPGGIRQPYSLLRHALLQRLEVPDTAPPEMVREKLESALTEFSGWNDALAEAATAATRAGYIGRLLGLDLGITLDAADARELHDRAISYLAGYFDALAARGAVGMLLEDIHWADDSSLDFLKRLAGSSQPGTVVLLCTARPSLLERRPLWAEGERFHTRVDLLPLTRSAARRLVDEVLQRVTEMPDDLRDLIVVNAEGNPYYVEELVRMMIHDGVIVTGEDDWRIEPGRLTELQVPQTLLGLLQARLDALPPLERDVLQRASVIGRTFWDKAVDWLGGDQQELDRADPDGGTPVAETLGDLRGREMVFRLERSTFDDAIEHSFKHALLRDVTYEGILKRSRRLYHARAARWLEDITSAADREEEYAWLIAEHYAMADDPVAASWYRRAGEWAAAQFANAEALKLFDRAVELTENSDDAGKFEIVAARYEVARLVSDRTRRASDVAELSAIAARLGDGAHMTRAAVAGVGLHVLAGEYAEAQTLAETAVEHALSAGDEKLTASAIVAVAEVLWRRGDVVAARRQVEKGMEMARRIGAPEIEANLQRTLGLLAEMQGRPEESLERYSAALEIYRGTGGRRAVARVLNDMGTASSHLGDYSAAAQYLEQSLQLRNLMGDVAGEEVVRNNLAIVAVGRADLPEGRRQYEEALALSQVLNSQEGGVSATQGLGAVAVRLGRFALARDLLEVGRAGFDEMGDAQGVAQCQLELAWIHLLTGEAQAGAELAVVVIRDAASGGFWPEHALANLVYGRALLGIGRREEAAEALQKAAVDETAEGGPAVPTMSRVGLAAALVDADPEAALAEIEAALAVLEAGGVSPLPDPAWAYVTGHRVLSELGDRRAEAVMEAGGRLLGAIVGRLEDPADLASFLENVESNRQLWAALGRS